MPLRELTDDDKTKAIDKTINLVSYSLHIKHFDHCREDLRTFLYAKVEGAFNNPVRDERLDKFVGRVYNNDKLDPMREEHRTLEPLFSELVDMFPTAYDIINGARPPEHGRHAGSGGISPPISQHRSSAHGSRPITHSHDSRPRGGTRVMPQFDPRGKRKSEDAHRADEAHKATRRANWKHATEQARPLSNHKENANSATHRVRQGIRILDSDANTSAQKQEEARQRAEKWRNVVQREARDKRPIDPEAFGALIPRRNAEETRKAEEARKAKDAEIARKAEEARKAKEAEIARKAEEARKAKDAEIARKAEEARKAKEAEIARNAEVARKAKEAEIARKAEVARKAKEAEIARKAEEARKAKEAEIARKAEEARKAKEAEIARKAGEAVNSAENDAANVLQLLVHNTDFTSPMNVGAYITEAAELGIRRSERIAISRGNKHQATCDEEDDSDSDDAYEMVQNPQQYESAERVTADSPTEDGEMLKPEPGRVCAVVNCSTRMNKRDNPQWRQGPGGKKELCNACGDKYKHDKERVQKHPKREGWYEMLKVKSKRSPPPHGASVPPPSSRKRARKESSSIVVQGTKCKPPWPKEASIELEKCVKASLDAGIPLRGKGGAFENGCKIHVRLGFKPHIKNRYNQPTESVGCKCNACQDEWCDHIQPRLKADENSWYNVGKDGDTEFYKNQLQPKQTTNQNQNQNQDQNEACTPRTPRDRINWNSPEGKEDSDRILKAVSEYKIDKDRNTVLWEEFREMFPELGSKYEAQQLKNRHQNLLMPPPSSSTIALRRENAELKRQLKALQRSQSATTSDTASFKSATRDHVEDDVVSETPPRSPGPSPAQF